MIPYRKLHQQSLPLTCLILFFILAFPGTPSAADSKQLEFSWGVFLDTKKGPRSLDFKTPEKLTLGDTFQLYLKPGKNTYIYAYHVGTDKSPTLISPEHLSNPKQPQTEIDYFIPAGNGRIRLTAPGGTEKIYLIASTKQLKQLEEMTRIYSSAPNDLEKRSHVIKELANLKRLNSKISEATIEGVPIAGNIFKSKSFPTLEKLIHKVSSEDFYLKILRIKHE